ncbi:TetR/AcrR family transcriptional regulator [Streptodolium elevatio]|uniref:TetR/AcrR family transcriptional regulator n=1 Tax=Streptodolium elevatio TaxID=3157996 RepID=A0ABV3DDV5_9ACTN
MNGVDTAAVVRERPRLRADARRNRERIVGAAREMFVEFGADVPLDDVARRAGVGNATLYRHFADRRELVHEVVLSVLERIVVSGEAATAEEPDAFAALRRFAHGAAEEKVAAVCPLLSEDIDKSHPDMVAMRERLDGVIGALVGRAHASGQLRADVGAGDLMMVITHLARPLPGTRCAANEQFVHRHLDIMLDGLRDLHPTPLTGSAVELRDLRGIGQAESHADKLANRRSSGHANRDGNG